MKKQPKHIEWALRPRAGNRLGDKCCICARLQWKKIVGDVWALREKGESGVSVSELHREMTHSYGATFGLSTLFRHIKVCLHGKEAR